ncbi:MAG: hypothetical protein WAK48_13480 [Candidatus Acidiferrum sp.]
MSPACAQTRLSDKDLEQRIKNMNSDIKQFRSMFNSSVSRSSIRKTTQEKDAKELVQQFQQASNSLYQTFKNTKKSDPYLQNCLVLATQIDRLMQSTQFDSTTVSQWARIKPQLKDISSAFQVPGY